MIISLSSYYVTKLINLLDVKMEQVILDKSLQQFIEKRTQIVKPVRFDYLKTENLETISKFFYSTLKNDGGQLPLVNPLELLEIVNPFKIQVPSISTLGAKERPIVKFPYFYWLTAQETISSKGKYTIIIKKGVILLLLAGVVIAMLWFLNLHLFKKKGLLKFLDWVRTLCKKCFKYICKKLGIRSLSEVEQMTDQQIEEVFSKALTIIPSKALMVISSKPLCSIYLKAIAVAMGKEAVYVSKDLVAMSKEIILYVNNGLILYSYQPDCID